ncbi:GNAT family N-acetyltransferase [Paenibacillus sp. GCM10012306]|uniref:bifunctional helix-turn-helix transcriptional regulator/GNAT family N-acetyltransferase n=1 Tax=Paenibacillus sp. GCM10012306 TaxID=3317342 RepID=UPI00361E89E6
MQSEQSEQLQVVPIIRQFNRFYTNVLGLLDQHLLDSDFSLSEARVLYEIGNNEQCTAKILIDRLRLDAGYLSRILKRFERENLTYRMPSEEDKRSYYLYLTEQGKNILHQLNTRSEQQIHQMISTLPDQEQQALAKSMTVIEQALSDEADVKAKPDIHIRHDLRPGDIGTLIQLHGWVYAKECGYNHSFEGYVCKTFYEFLEHYNPDKDRFWLAEAGGELVGAIAIIGHSSEKAQLRWFILHPDYRGFGLGKKLLGEALQYCRDKQYQTVFLETTEDQKTAIAMYEKVGFRKTGERENKAWGVQHVEQTFEMNLHYSVTR